MIEYGPKSQAAFWTKPAKPSSALAPPKEDSVMPNNPAPLAWGLAVPAGGFSMFEPGLGSKLRAVLRAGFRAAVLAIVWTAVWAMGPGEAMSQNAQPSGGLASGEQIAADRASGDQALADRASGGPWRVIYVEGGPYRDFVMNLVGLARGLEELGLIEDGAVPIPQSEDASGVWGYLSERAGGDRLVFLADGFYSGGWDDEKLEEIGAGILERLQSGQVDLVLALGTQAGLMMATEAHRVPTLSITATDPVTAGISKTAERSGLPHVHVQVEAGRIERQLAMFHNLIGFRTLGVPLDSTAAGMATMGEPTIRRVARERGFELVECRADLKVPSVEESLGNLLGCLESLSQESDAVYLTVSNAMVADRLGEILAPLTARGLPTFSQKGAVETRLGVLMSMAEDDFINSGRFEAEVVRDVLSGRLPGDVGQIYLPPLTMALNFDTAMAIGWDPPFELLAMVDEIVVRKGGPARLPVAVDPAR